MTKVDLRRRLLWHRKQLQPEAVVSLGQRAQRRLMQTRTFDQARRLMLYSPIQNEVGTDLILREALRHQKIVVYPRVRGEWLTLVRVQSPRELQPGAYGIKEPVGTETLSIDAVDMVVVPGVAFDKNGYRLGYGKGFYDRLLTSGGFNGHLIGLCYGFQMVKNMPTEAHDVPVHSVVTEKETLAIPPV